MNSRAPSGNSWCSIYRENLDPYRIMTGKITGLTSANSHHNQTLTFPQPFRDAGSYAISMFGANSNNNYSQSVGFKSLTTTNCVWNSSYWHNRDANVTQFVWVAIGIFKY